MHTVLLQMIAEGMEIAAIFVRHIKSQVSSLQGPSSPHTAGGVVGVSTGFRDAASGNICDDPGVL
jgi:hypothetical protein